MISKGSRCVAVPFQAWSLQPSCDRDPLQLLGLWCKAWRRKYFVAREEAHSEKECMITGEAFPESNVLVREVSRVSSYPKRALLIQRTNL